MTKKEKRKKRERRVLTSAIVLALLIVAGGTFAWFTSRDEVTNKLSAEQNYNVSITENFVTPSSWVPGQEVSKEVGVVNTGNIDAFVKLSINSQIEVTILGEPEAFNADNVDSYVKLSADDVKALKAGGYLVCKAGTVVAAEDQNVGTSYDDFATAGLYVFERTLADNEDNVTYQYVGLYSDGTNCYAIDKVEKTATAFSAKVQKTEKLDLAQMELDYSKATVSEDKPYIRAFFSSVMAGAEDDITINIMLDKDELANWTLLADNDASANPYGADGMAFYYNKTLAPAETSGYLITAVELDGSVSEEAYVKFDYDLTILSDSIQSVPSKDATLANITKAVDALDTWSTITDGTPAKATGAENYTQVTGITWED